MVMAAQNNQDSAQAQPNGVCALHFVPGVTQRIGKVEIGRGECVFSTCVHRYTGIHQHQGQVSQE